MSDSSKSKDVYTVVERDGKTFWQRIGVAFVNSDGSITVTLGALPVSGEITMRDRVKKESSS